MSSQELPDLEQQLRNAYEEVGPNGIARLVAAFYRYVPNDDILGPMYPNQDWQGAEIRLREFLDFRWGGVQDYLTHRGHPRLRMRHAPFRIDQRARDRWLEIMDRAFAEVNFSEQSERVFRSFLASTASFLVNTSEITEPPRP